MALVARSQYLIPRHRCALPFGAQLPEARNGLHPLAALDGTQQFEEADLTSVEGLCCMVPSERVRSGVDCANDARIRCAR